MDVASNCIMCLGGILLDPLKRQVQYIKDLNENVQHLLREWEELLTQQNDVIRRVEREGLRLMEILNQNEVDRWLGNVNGMKEPVNGIEREFGEDKRCLNGCLPNYYSLLKLAKETQRLIREVKDLSEKKPSVNVDVIQVPPAMLLIPTVSFKGAAAKNAFESIYNCLMNKEIAKIGVYGMGGVGKTTIMKNIKNSLQQENIFTAIVFETVSRCPDLETIQKSIAAQIGLPLPTNYCKEICSTMLHEALQRRKRCLLILDDLWSELPLKDVGIPEPHADFKVVFTTRLHSVCRSMGTQEEIKVEVLSQDDAWSLFQENACMTDPQVKDVAKQVVKECGGLPLAIITIGQALRGENDVGVWRNALNQLKGSTTDIPGMEKGVFVKLKFSFDYLRNEKLKACFLYCSLFPEDYNLKANMLIDHWIWDDLIHQMDNKQDEVDNGRSLLSELKRACMLEFDDSSDTVKMHDLMRDMAIAITKANPRFMVKAGLRLEKAPAENEWPEDVERISLMNNNIVKLSRQPRCPRLLTLLLNGNYSLLEIIPHSFFDSMCNLRVLDLSETLLKMLPDSICNLEKLRVLLLNGCRSLEKMPSLAKLKELRVLHLSCTLVEEMPESLASLENLLELNLAACWKLKMLPSFTNLKRLRSLDLSFCVSIEELPGSFYELENLNDLELNHCLKLKIGPSLSVLRGLKNLNLANTSIEELPKYLSDLKNLEELNLRKCSKLKMVSMLANLKKLKKLYLTCTYIEELPESLSDLEKLCELGLEYNLKLKMVPSLAKLRDLRKLDLSFTCIEELPESLSDLENLHILNLDNCKNLKRVPSLEKVEQLRILNLASTIIEELPEGMERLAALKILHLSHTKRLRRFRHGILPKLSLLQEFSTKGSLCLCSSNVAGTMEGQIDSKEIIGLTQLTTASFDCDDLSALFYLFKFLQVRELKLRAVIKSSQPPSSEFEDKTVLLEFCRKISYGKMMPCNEIKIIGQHDIICLSDFLLDMGLMKLDACYIDSCDGMQFAFVGQDNNGLLLPKLRQITVSTCPKLKNLFSFQLLQSLQNLMSIGVKDCDTMEELIAGDDDETGEKIVLPKLRSLVLINLPALERISSKPLVCKSLEEIRIIRCPRLKKISTWNDTLPWHDPPNPEMLLQPFFIDNQETEA